MKSVVTKNERTSKRVAGIAGQVLQTLKRLDVYANAVVEVHGAYVCSVRELKALAASALTQAPDEPGSTGIKKKAVKKVSVVKVEGHG